LTARPGPASLSPALDGTAWHGPFDYCAEETGDQEVAVGEDGSNSDVDDDGNDDGAQQGQENRQQEQEDDDSLAGSWSCQPAQVP